MIGQTISHYKVVEKPPTTSRKNGTPPGQVAEGGMGIVYKVPKSPTSASQQVAVILRTQRSLKW
jgi:hypothetical protein